MLSYDQTFKILLLGDSEVDKSAMIWRYVANIPQPYEWLTIGVEFIVKNLVIDDEMYKLQLWDLTGEERFRFLLPQYCIGANAAVLLYDVSKSQTLDNIGEWINIVRQKSGDIPIMLVGIIPDEKSERQVSVEEGKKIANSRNLSGYIECSIKTGDNLEKMFEDLTGLILDYYDIPSKLKEKKSSDENYSTPSKPPFQPEGKKENEEFRERIRNLGIRLEEYVGVKLRVVAGVIVQEKGTIVYSTDKVDIFDDISRVISSWNSLSAQFIVISGVKYAVLQCTSDIFVATSIKGELQIIRVKDGEYNVFIYLVFDQ